MYCKKCGNFISERENYCGKCGASAGRDYEWVNLENYTGKVYNEDSCYTRSYKYKRGLWTEETVVKDYRRPRG